MTLAPGHLDTGGNLTRPLPVRVPGASQPPRLAGGIELLATYQASGYDRPPSLVRRSDGQIIQLSPLLYLVISHLDGTRDPAVIADRVSADLGPRLSAGQ